ncbi:PREDICTED: coiled-coil domain-containing protein 174 [Dinoponera quadriceps]|uniref:Coiled-coil domain-containing protein 174 n=1 Tax=Dinoponera quadriceps TaxID=609295 RepID=A0A6P3XPP0_DINQU|nr:PREDICTED: coiled-coil domain-containing protein 174 [Dinoponera quadriceps]XP_014479933.1 PREDICTED: coiled-coil domain-containing protein 174 [Dinoponera quadriceps]
MNVTKKINVNFSSLVGLKAELLRKQAEVNEAKLKTEPINVLPQLNKKRTKKTNVENTEKHIKETVDPEDIIAHKKSRLMLEAKTRLYERLKKSKSNNDKFLVDFKNKMDESDDFVDETINDEYPIEPEENWVEYQDCFGRTRKCLQEDLPHMQRKDDIIKQEIMKRNANNTREDGNEEQYSTVEEKEPEIEIMRRKWEEQTQKLADKIDIHYQDILFDEARTHGVGYYAFSQDEEHRIKQQENLANLRKETEKKQKEMKDIKELKERMEQNRLKAARIRQRIRAGLPAEPTEEELAQESNSTIKTGNIDVKEVDGESVEKDEEKSTEGPDGDKSVKEINATSEKVISDEDKIKAFEHLLGKRDHWHVMSQKEWVYKYRAQRIKEFAPVYSNFKSAGFHNSSQSIGEQSNQENNKKLDNSESNSQKTIHNTKDSTDLEKHEASDDFIAINKPVSVARDTGDSQNNKDSLTQCKVSEKDNTRHELLGNVTKSTSNLATSLPNELQSQRQATVSYPLSHLSSKYSCVTYDYSKAHVTEEHKLPSAKDIPLPGENLTTYTESNDNATHISKQETLPRSINEDNIMAGLKYLREKFEENHSK